jgi:hypothetical protein
LRPKGFVPAVNHAFSTRSGTGSSPASAREDDHPWGCHKPRISDEVVFDRLVQVLVFGCGYERAADSDWSATTQRRRRDEWLVARVMEALRLLVLAAHDRMMGLELGRLSADGCITEAPSGGERAGKSPR